jgi:hypothetical protein
MPQRILFAAWPRFDRAEVAFWRALRDHLADHHLSLVLASSMTPPADLDVEHVALTTTPDAFWPVTDGALSAVPLSIIGLDAETLLARETAWSGPALIPAIARSRREAFGLMAGERLHWLQTLAPVLTVIWNGQHAAELILAAASRLGGIPVLFAERAPITEALFVDEHGLSSASAVAATRPWPMPPANWQALAHAVCDQIVQTRSTWWEQPRSRAASAPELRAALQIPDEARVILFAGQVDEDTQSFLFSSQHASNLDAFEWLLQAVAALPDVYVVGKQHPKSRTPAARYAERLARSGVRGQWRDDLSVEDAFAVADRVAAVNSTMLYEALANQCPALAMGDWLLSGQGAAYETTTEADTAVRDWWTARDFGAKLERFYAALGHLLSRSVYAFDASGTRTGMHDARALAERIANGVAHRPWHVPDSLSADLARTRGTQVANWSPADAAWTERRDALTERLTQWHVGQSLRAALLPAYQAARHDRRIRVWGSGSARHAIAALLEASGAFVDSYVPASELIRRAPVPDFIIVATADHDGTTQHLESLGFQRGTDYSVVEPHLLHALSLRDRHAGAA